MPQPERVQMMGMRFGRLVVVEELPIEERGRRDMREFICQCDCGNQTRVRKGNLISGNSLSCGCLAKELAHKKAVDGMLGKRFGRLTVLRESDTSQYRKLRLLCQCDCGELKDVGADDLRSGQTRSCGCLRREVSGSRCFEDITGQTFNELTAVKRVEDYIAPTGNPSTQWLFRCTCGREIVALAQNVKRGLSKSCGHIGKSYAELQINEYLRSVGVKFEYDIGPFDDMVNPETGRKLKIDFVVTNNNGELILIEHQGQQHFYEYARPFGQMQREVTDQLKKDYCSSHNIKLFETRYDEDYIAHVEQILMENNCIPMKWGDTYDEPHEKVS